MKVNIVLWEDNHIVPRMTDWLVMRNGWSVSVKADPHAHVNYYMPYLVVGNGDELPPTLTAAWFTHYEEGTPWKMDIWNDAAMLIDKPLVTAKQYLQTLDNASVITPGVDMDQYYPIAGTKEHDRPVVGIVGVGQPRKGPKLIVDLFYGDTLLDLRIVGPNWPFPSMELDNPSMPQFYSMIDLYLCTSTIEGIPAPVLEALACDKKVVIPHGVGICDDIPEMPGVRHYVKGNSESMKNAIEFALTDEPHPGTLRDYVGAHFTIDNWCSSTKLALEKVADAAIQI